MFESCGTWHVISHNPKVKLARHTSIFAKTLLIKQPRAAIGT